MKIYKYENSLKELVYSRKPIIFLAGPTVRGNQPHLTSWRIDAVNEFQSQNFDGSLVIPEFTSKTESDKGKYWIPKWEFAGLMVSDIVMFWIPRTKELIGLTTNHEMGYWLGRKRSKVVYGRPDDSYRNSYLDLMWEVDAEQKGIKKPLKIFNTLKDTVAGSIFQAYDSDNLIYNREFSKIKVESPYGDFSME